MGLAAAVPRARAAHRERVLRFRAGRWLTRHAHSTHEVRAAWLFVFVSWSLRGGAVFLLVAAGQLARRIRPRHAHAVA